MRKSNTSFLAAVVLIGGALAAVYCRALHAPFLFDDTSNIIKNSSLTKLWPLVGDTTNPGPLNPPKNLPTSGRPLVSLSLALNYHFGQLDPLGYHLFNLIVHGLSAVLLMAIVWRTLSLKYFAGRFDHVSGPIAFATALLWALHPLQTETVIYVSQRTELMVGFFYLATLYGSLRYWAAALPAARNIWLAIATLACLAGMASKEVMVTAPVVVLLFDRTFISGAFRRAWQHSRPLYVGLFLSWGLLILLNYSAPRSGATGFDRGLAGYVWWFTQAKVLLLYLKLAVWPWPLSIHYEIDYLDTLGAAWPWLLPVGILGIVTVALLWRRSALGFIGAWVLLILSPTLVVPIVTEVAAERRMYLPLAALMALFVAGGYWLLQQAARRVSADADGATSGRWPNAITTGAVFVLAVVFCAVSVRRLAAYHNAVSLWQDALASQPDDPFAYNNLGISLLDAGRLPEAIECIRQALRLKPEFAEAYYNLGFALNQAANTPAAIADSQHSPPSRSDYVAQGDDAVHRHQRLQEIIACFSQALRVKPDFPEAEYYLGVALDQAGKPPEAIEHFQQAIRLKPNFPEAHFRLGAALHSAGKSPEAIVQLQQALDLKPDYAEAHLMLGVALGQTGRLDEALSQFQQTLRLDPNSIDAYTNSTKAYALLGRRGEAIDSAEKALALAHSLNQPAVTQQIEAWLKEFRTQNGVQPNPATRPPANQPAR